MVWRCLHWDRKIKDWRACRKTGITKRTIDYYTNIGLLDAERSATNYRYYDQAMIKRLQFIEQRKQQGLSLVQIQHELNITPYEEIDVQVLRLKMQDLEHDVTSLLAQMNKQDDKKLKRLRKMFHPKVLH